MEKRDEPGKKSKKEKSDGYTLSFYNGYFGDSFGRKKNCLREEVYLVVTSSKIRLELSYIKSLFHKAVQNTHGEKMKLLRCQPYLCTDLTNFIRF